MKADTRFVEDVKHPDQLRSDLGSQSDALRFAAAECPGGAVQREVIEPDIKQELQPFTDLFDDLVTDLLLART